MENLDFIVVSLCDSCCPRQDLVLVDLDNRVNKLWHSLGEAVLTEFSLFRTRQNSHSVSAFERSCLGFFNLMFAQLFGTSK